MVVVYAENDTIMNIETDKLIDGLAHLMACYYVFNVEYPRVCKSSLLFLQEIVMGKRNMADRRPVRYSTYLARSQLDELQTGE